jgi:hypothetical protein
MKKLSIFASLATAAVIFSGCGGGGGGPVGPVGPVVPDVLYLDDAAGGGLGGIPYICDSGTSGLTGVDGSFEFFSPDNCTFDFTGYNGTLAFWDPIYLDFADSSGVAWVNYDCWSGIAGQTDLGGYFDYDIDDECTFYGL